MKMTEEHDLSQERPLVTFAVFAYNQEKYIREAVEGAFSQTYEPLEIILSDDCSSDRTFEIMQEMAAAYKGPSQIKLIRNQKNLGLADHINNVVQSSKGTIISWAAGDDIALPERTDKFVRKMIDEPNIIGVHSDVEEIDINGEFTSIRKHHFDASCLTIDGVVKSGLSVVTQSHAFRRVVFDIFGPFRSDLTQEGIAMAFREVALGRIAFIDEPLTKYRIGCGVSTYNGSDSYKIRYLEPVKYTKWYLSAFRQMRDDCEKINLDNKLFIIKIIEKNIKFFSNLYEINSKKNTMWRLVENTFIKPGDFRSLRAVIRLLVPDKLYSSFLKKGF